jgi:N-acetylglucosamine-6-sulfatase/beta-glucosidase
MDPAAVASPNLSVWAQARLATIQMQELIPAPVVVLGDSIFEEFAFGPGAPVWFQSWLPRGATDLAIYGSTTNNVLWQVESGELAHLSPRVVVVNVGVNNFFLGQSPQEVAGGIAAVVGAIRSAEPQAQVVLVGLLPTAWSWDGLDNDKVQQTNALIAPLGDQPNVHYVDPTHALEQPNGSILPGVLVDGLHPTAEGYVLLQGVLQPVLESL